MKKIEVEISETQLAWLDKMLEAGNLDRDVLIRKIINFTTEREADFRAYLRGYEPVKMGSFDKPVTR